MKKRAWLIGYFAQTNMGDEAILASALENLPDWAVPRVLTSSESCTRAIHRADCVLCPPLDRRSKSGSLNRVKYWVRQRLAAASRSPHDSAVCLCLRRLDHRSHGGPCCPNARPRAVAERHGLPSGRARRAGVDPLTLPEDREAARELVAGELAYCSVRDSDSAAVLRGLGVPDGRFHEAADLVYALTVPALPARHEPPLPLEKAHAGLNLRRLCCDAHDRGGNEPSRYLAYQQECERVVAGLKKTVGRLSLVPFAARTTIFWQPSVRGRELRCSRTAPSPGRCCVTSLPSIALWECGITPSSSPCSPKCRWFRWCIPPRSGRLPENWGSMPTCWPSATAS